MTITIRESCNMTVKIQKLFLNFQKQIQILLFHQKKKKEKKTNNLSHKNTAKNAKGKIK